MTEQEAITVSVVVPMHNESGNVRELVRQVVDALSSLSLEYEVILVDDGSRDDTWLRIKDEAERLTCISGIKLSRNFGHQKALLAGLHHAKGQAIISMDGDLQHPPETLPKLIQEWQSGQKIVFTKRQGTEDLSTFKRKTSEWFYHFFSWLSGVEITKGSSDFRLVDRQVLEQMLRFNDVDPFLRGAVRWLGFDEKTSSIEYQLGKRNAGETSYTLKRMIAFANTAVISFSTKPLVIGIWLGLLTGLLAFLELIYITAQYLLGNTVPGWASTVGIVALLFGILFIILGVIGLYLARIHRSLQERPQFVVDEVTTFKKASQK